MAGRKYGIKKKTHLNNAVKSAQIRSVFIFFSFFIVWGRPFFFLVFLFLTVSSRIRVRGRRRVGTWRAAKEEVNDRGWRRGPARALWRVSAPRCRGVTFLRLSAPVGRPSSDLHFLPQRPRGGRSSNPGWWCWPCRPVAPRCAGCSGEECCRQPGHLGERRRSCLFSYFAASFISHHSKRKRHFSVVAVKVVPKGS